MRPPKSLEFLARRVEVLPQLAGLSLQAGDPGLRLLVQAVIPLGLRAFLQAGLIESVVVADRGGVGEVFPEGLEFPLQRDELPLEVLPLGDLFQEGVLQEPLGFRGLLGWGRLVRVGIQVGKG